MIKNINEKELNERCPGGIHLDSCYANPYLIEAVEACVFDLMENY